MRRRVKLGLIVIVALALMACATFQQNTYRTLYTAGTSYDTAMTTVSTFQKQGLISTAQREEINKLANIYYVAYHASVDAFEAYKLSTTSSNEEKVISSMTSMFSRWKDFASYVNRLRPGTLAPDLAEVDK